MATNKTPEEWARDALRTVLIRALRTIAIEYALMAWEQSR